MKTITMNIDPGVDGNAQTVVAFASEHLTLTAADARAISKIFAGFAEGMEELESGAAEDIRADQTCRVLFADPAVESFTAPKNGTDFSADDLQDIVGGYFQIIPLGDQKIMVLNEDGKATKLPVNQAATALAHEHRAISRFDFIVGDVLVCPASMVK